MCSACANAGRIEGSHGLQNQLAAQAQPSLRLGRYYKPVPADAPASKPDVGSIVATPVFVLLQVPPAVASLSVVALPVHIVAVPVILVSG